MVPPCAALARELRLVSGHRKQHDGQKEEAEQQRSPMRVRSSMDTDSRFATSFALSTFFIR